MKVKIGKYPSRLTCNIHTRLMKSRYGADWPSAQTPFEKAVEKLEDVIQSIYQVPNWVLDRRERKVQVRIDPSDTFSMDETLSHVIFPMLRQLQGTKHGSPHVDDDDVPEHLKRSATGQVEDPSEIDDNWHARWEWVLSEMIWAFEQSAAGDWEMQYCEFEECSEDDTPPGLRMTKNDVEGKTKHHARMVNGHRLFGKYYQNLWD